MPLAHEVDFGMRDHLLYEFARDLSSSLELDVVLAKVMERVITLMKAARGFIVLVDPVTGTWNALSGVNITLGLPIIRTSVDHGTAFDIAGKGIANEQSMEEAIRYAARLAGAKRR